MKKIELTQGKYAIVDDNDYAYLSQWNWNCNKNNRAFYAVRTVNHSGKMNMHRQLIGDVEGKVCDHINGDGLDNRRSNLRHATHSENMRNRKLNLNNTTGYKVVSWRPKPNKWESSIRVNGKYRYLGRFSTLMEASEAYNSAALRYFGKFSKLNS